MSSKAGPTAGGDDRQLNHTATSEDGCGTALEMRKKKARRVSFAEMTSVHFFDRDEEETPRDSLAKAGEGNAVEENELSFPQFVNLKANDDGEDGEDGNVSDDDEDGELAMRRSFLRPMESPSPGSTIGSATSNDDHFFGPVSPNFIRPGRLSDSAASDDNHDITMDSTAFSMHFRSLARSELGVDLKTPTGIHLSFEEKTPTCTRGNSMVLTETKKPISSSSFPAVIASGTSDSSDMSLVGEHLQKYEYGRLPPDLDALLAEGEMELDIAPRSDNISASTLPTNEKPNHLASEEDGSGLMDLDESDKQEAGATAFDNMPSETLDRMLDKSNGALEVAPLSHDTYGSSFSVSNPPDSGISVDNGTLLSNQLSKDKLIHNNMEASFDASEDWRSEKLSSVNCDTLLSPDSRHHVHGHTPRKLKSPLTGFASPSPAKRRLILTGSSAQKYRSRVISAQDDSFIGKENMISLVSSASIQRSISKLERLKASAFSSAMGDRIDDVLVRSLEFIKTPPISSNLEKVNEDLKEKLADIPIICAEEQFSDVAQIEGQERQSFGMDSKSFKALAHDEGKNYSPLISEDPKGKMLFTSRIDSLQAEFIGQKQVTGTSQQIHFSPGKSSEKLSSTLQKFLCSPNGKSRLLDQQKVSSVLNETCETATHSKNDLSMGVVDCVLYDPASCLIERNSNGPSLETPESLTHGSGRKDLQPQELNNSKPFSVTQDLQLVTHNMLDGSSHNSAQERGNNKLLVEHRESQDEIITLQRSPKLQKYQSVDISSRPDEVCSGNLIVGTGLKYLSDIKSKFMENADQWASLSIGKLNVHELQIDMLQEFIPYMQKSKTYETLHHELLSQKTSAPQNLKEKRIAEARLLMCRVMYEKAKLHLMRVKQEKLQEKFQTISSGVQECKSLKLNSLPQLSTKFAKDLHIDVLCLQRSFVNLNGMQEVACNKVSTMMQALEVSDKKITNLNKYFHTHFKMKGELNCNDTIALVKDYLVKRKCCRFFRQEMQMGVIHNMWSSAGHHTVVLNYLGILIQSLKIVAGSTSSIIISNELNDMAITKSFPNMDACSVFAFVLPGEISRKYVGARSLAQEVQMTQSLLGNLVDVVEEVQLARIELCNLIDTRFCSPTAGDLDLQLHFISFKSGIKVKVTLGLSFLNRGIYPWEIIPCVCATGADGTDEAIVGDVENALKSVKPGYMRIIRLCRCISSAIQSASW
nr:uncharacterized protein LOC109188339 isoform X1 [Ipomoea batatas]